MQYLFSLLFDYFALLFINAVGRYKSTHRRKWINITVTSNNSSRIQDTSTSDFHFITQHRTKLFHACLDLFSACFYNNKFLV